MYHVSNGFLLFSLVLLNIAIVNATNKYSFEDVFYSAVKKERGNTGMFPLSASWSDTLDKPNVYQFNCGEGTEELRVLDCLLQQVMLSHMVNVERDIVVGATSHLILNIELDLLKVALRLTDKRTMANVVGNGESHTFNTDKKKYMYLETYEQYRPRWENRLLLKENHKGGNEFFAIGINSTYRGEHISCRYAVKIERDTNVVAAYEDFISDA